MGKDSGLETGATTRERNRMEFDHVGIAVTDIEEALRLHVDRLGGELLHRERVEHEGVELAFVGQIEILAPLPEQENALLRFLQQRGEGLHHLAYRVEDLDETLERMRAGGFEVVEGYPKFGARGMRVAFLHPKTTGGVLFELCERPEEDN